MLLLFAGYLKRVCAILDVVRSWVDGTHLGTGQRNAPLLPEECHVLASLYYRDFLFHFSIVQAAPLGQCSELIQFFGNLFL